MKRIALTVLSLVIATSFSGLVAAQTYGSQNSYAPENSRRASARVTRVERMSNRDAGYRRDPYQRQECWNESTNRNESGYYRDESGRLYRGDSSSKTTRTVIGAIVGGALGTQVGGGDGRTAATIAGAAIGAAIGGNSGRDNRYEGYDRYSDNSGTERRCRTIGGNGGRDTYRVSYTYAGLAYQTVTNINPGRTLRVLVDVRPEDD
ncbi:MAG: glycine zipper 2TM domain-containing protein [Lysobacter sp.]|nr:glycine zipper 2TM domain-containing protein [Lysobacter sp.]